MQRERLMPFQYIPPPRATAKQWKTIASLGRFFGVSSRELAADILRRDVADVKRDGLTKREATRVIIAAIKRQNGDAS